MTSAKIVAGIDGSPAATAAIKWAARQACSRAGHLQLIHAFTWPGFPGALGAIGVGAELREFAAQLVSESVEIARRAEPGVKVEGISHTGFPSPLLIKASETADLVVIGTRGLGVTVGGLVGSTGLDLAANAHCPVVIVQLGQNVTDRPFVVIGYDGSAAGTAALGFGLDHAQCHGLQVRVVAPESLAPEAGQPTGPELLSRVKSLPGGENAEVVQVGGHPAEQLLRLSADAQLIVLGSRGRGGFTGMLLGSVCQNVLHHAVCPVAVIPTAADGDSSR